MLRLLKKLAPAPSVSFADRPAETDFANSSADELRDVINDLETVIAEHEATNAFLRDLLAQRWFEEPVDEFDEPVLQDV